MKHGGSIRRWIAILVIGFGIGFLSFSPANGQSTSASITGVVTDPSGAVVRGAKVIVTSEGLGTTRQAISGSTGIFTVTNLPVGSYNIAVSASGFAPYQVLGQNLSSNQILNMDVHLNLAHVSGTVVHVRGRTAISTQTTNISNVLTARDVAQLPITAVVRQAGDQGITGLELLNPGTSSGSSVLNVAGIPELSVIPSMDGITVTANQVGVGGGPIQPNMDAIQQLHTQLANTPAEFSTPANITVVTKSGTNAFHGGAFWNWNGDALNARQYFSSSVPFRVYNDFGANFGGPIKKNRTFFFVDYEGSREAASTVLNLNTPLAAWRTGDFSGLSTPVIDPTTGQPFPGNKIPADRINQVSEKAQEYFYPLPNFGAPDQQSGNWRGQRPSATGFTHFDNFDVRVDQSFPNGDTVFGRFSYRRMPLQIYQSNLPPVGERVQLRTAESAVLSWTHLFSSALLNEIRYGFTRQRNRYNTPLIGSDIIQQLGIQGTSVTGVFGVPAITMPGITTTNMSNNNNLTLDTDFELSDNLSWVKGRHSMKFGFDLVRDQVGGFGIPNTVYGGYDFNGTFTGFPYADFLLGIPQETDLTVPTPARHLRGTTWGAYAQDQFRITSKVTLNYGLRWQLDGPYYDRYGIYANFDPAIDGWVVADDGLAHVNKLYPTNIPVVAASTVGYPSRTLLDRNSFRFYPRIGISVQPFNKTVLKAAYGIYAVQIYGGLGLQLNGGPFSGSETFINQITNGQPLFSFPDPFLPTGVTGSQNAFGFSPHLREPYTQQWNLTIERQIGDAALRVSYVGTHSVNLVYARNLNQPHPSTTPFTPSEYPYPNFIRVTWWDNGADEEYNGLQASIAKTFGSNLTFNAGWTWSKDLTDAQMRGSFAGAQIQNQYDLASEWGPNLLTPPQRVYGFAVYQLPFGKGQHFLNESPLLVQAIFGGWQMAWNVNLRSGLYYTPSYSGFDSSNTNTFGGRPDVVPGVSTKPVGKQTIDNFFNPAAFKIPGCPDNDPVCSNPANVGRFGNSRIGSLRGPASYNADLAISKFFPLYNTLRLQFQANALNVFNHPTFNPPSANISSTGTVGRITRQADTGLGQSRSRELVLMLRLEF